MKKRNKGIMLSYLFFALNTIISIFITAFIIRSVGQTNYGVYQSITAFVSYLIILEFGTGTLMTRNISLCKKDGTEELEIKKNTSTIFSLTVILSALILIISVLFWLSIDYIYSNSFSVEQIILGKRLFVFAVINLILVFFTQTLNGLLIGYKCYLVEKTISIIKLILRVVILVALLTHNNSIYIVVIVDSSLSLGCFLITLFYCIFKLKVKISFKYFDKKIFKLIIPLAFAMLLQTIVNTVNGSVDKFLISIMMTPDDVAVYSVAMSMFTMFSSVASVPISMYMPSIAEKMRQGMAGKKLTQELVQPCRLNVLISGALAFGFLCIGRPFIQIIYGAQYSDAWIYALLVIIPMFINMSNAIVINIIDILRKRHVRSIILLATTALNIYLTIYSIKYIGMIGAAAATGISLICQTIVLNIFYTKKININSGYLLIKSYKGILPCFLGTSLISLAISQLIKNIYIEFFVSGILFVGLFAVSYYLWGANEYEKTTIKKILKRKS